MFVDGQFLLKIYITACTYMFLRFYELDFKSRWRRDADVEDVRKLVEATMRYQTQMHPVKLSSLLMCEVVLRRTYSILKSVCIFDGSRQSVISSLRDLSKCLMILSFDRRVRVHTCATNDTPAHSPELIGMSGIREMILH